MKRWLVVVAVVATSACAGFQKECAKSNATRFGADWIVVQYDSAGRPFHCWKLTNVSLTGTEGGNVDWKDESGHLMHVTGWENRVQVKGGDFSAAAHLVGVDAAKCENGVYPAPGK